jgi:hypothetical protein
VSFIGETPVYIEGRNGNSPAKYKINETIERSLELCKENRIKIGRFRSDEAGYTKEVIRLMSFHKIEFFIRCRLSQSIINSALNPNEKWEKIQIKGREQLTINLEHYVNNKPYRVVLSKVLNTSTNEYVHRAIITSNLEWSTKQVIEFYNQRGAIERHFDDLKNNFNWGRLPFSFLEENTVFLIIGAIAKVTYQYLLKTYSKKLDFLKRNFRLKNFITHFISVSAQWKEGKLIMYTNKNYKKILS